MQLWDTWQWWHVNWYWRICWKLLRLPEQGLWSERSQRWGWKKQDKVPWASEGTPQGSHSLRHWVTLRVPGQLSLCARIILGLKQHPLSGYLINPFSIILGTSVTFFDTIRKIDSADVFIWFLEIQVCWSKVT